MSILARPAGSRRPAPEAPAPSSGPVVNGWFRGQAVTGQQRYAAELADRLPQHLPGVAEVRPLRLTAGNRYAAWAELQLRLPAVARGRTLVSLTGRAPLGHRRQVVTIHDLFPLTHPEWYAASYLAVHRRVLRHHLRHAAAITVVSEPVREQVVDLLRRDVPVVTVPNAPSPRFAELDDGRAPTSVPLAGSAGFVLTVGSLEPRKNLGRLLRAYALLEPELRAAYPLVVVGERGAAFRDAGLDEGLAGLDGVRFTGRVPDQELARLYRTATVFASVSLAEGFGIPVVEAASVATGRLLLSDIDSYRWVVGEGPATFVAPTSVESIEAGLREALAGSPDVPALRRLAGRFSWDDSARTLADLVRAVG